MQKWQCSRLTEGLPMGWVGEGLGRVLVEWRCLTSCSWSMSKSKLTKSSTEDGDKTEKTKPFSTALYQKEASNIMQSSWPWLVPGSLYVRQERKHFFHLLFASLCCLKMASSIKVLFGRMASIFGYLKTNWIFLISPAYFECKADILVQK